MNTQWRDKGKISDKLLPVFSFLHIFYFVFSIWEKKYREFLIGLGIRMSSYKASL